MNVLLKHNSTFRTAFLTFTTRNVNCVSTLSPLPNIYSENNNKQIQFGSRRYFANTLSEIWQNVSNSSAVAYMQKTLVQIHDYTGLPWWGSIILTTFMFRTFITLPLTIYQYKIAARLENISLELPNIVNELKKETAIAKRKFHWTDEQAKFMFRRSVKKQWNNLIVRDNCHPFKTFIVIWGQIPLWICQSMALRNMVYMLPFPDSLEAQVTFTQLTLGGFSWIPNLTEVDSSFILPVTLGLLNLSIIQIQTMLRVRQTTRLQRIATNVFRVLSLGMIPIAATVPSCLCLYWVTSSTYGLVQNLVLVSPSVRRSVGIPKTNVELQDPYQHLLLSVKTLVDKNKDSPDVNPK